MGAAVFLGLDWCHLDHPENLGMMGVIPAWKIAECLP
jgi:hypothetical protein